MTTSRRTPVFFFAVVLICISVPAFGVTIRMASIAPENSPWGRALNRLAAEWNDISDGRVSLQVFHNSVAGDESDMIRKMRIGQLQAGVFSNVGMTALSDKVLTLSMPLLIRTEDEYDYVFQRVRGTLDDEIESEGFVPLAWSLAGWLRFFSKDELRDPDELQGVKLAASPDEMQLVRGYQLMGYQPIPIPHAERLSTLTSGMANAHLTVPILAASFQWFGATPYMVSMKIGPAPGAIIMTRRAYAQLPRDIRDELVAAVKNVQDNYGREIRNLEQEAIDTMTNYGLEIIELSETRQEEWIQEFESSYDVMLGRVFDRDLYNRVREHLNEFRSSD
ncbi:MAG: TRAP transporter substrate-binding protein DctP [Spirochaetaceae bacterium]